MTLKAMYYEKRRISGPDEATKRKFYSNVNIACKPYIRDCVTFVYLRSDYFWMHDASRTSQVGQNINVRLVAMTIKFNK